MANLLNQNIGTNYKGILNLNTLNGNLTSTLQAVTDGMGNASPLQLSTTNVAMLAATFFGASSATTNILTLQSTTRNQLKVESGSTLEFWRSAGVESARFDANGNFLINATSASARLQVRGDGTNPIARFQNNAGTDLLIINQGDTANISFGSALSLIGNTGTSTFSSLIAANVTGNVGTLPVYSFNMVADTSTSSTSNYFSLSKSITPNAGSANFRNLILDYTINASGAQTGTATGIYLNATETALNGMGHNLLDLQVGGVSKLSVKNTGQLILDPTFGLKFGASSTNITAPSNGNLTLLDNAGTSFNRLQFGGTTNAFPAIKRNGAGIDFRLADDSGYASITASKLILPNTTTGTGLTMGEAVNNSSNFMNSGTGGGWLWYFTTGDNSYNSTNIRMNIADGGVCIGNSGMTAGTSASASLEIRSTTKGFLPPVMTTTEVNAIASPAEGLVVFNTTISHLCVYAGGTWNKLNQSSM
jgi:hypothetical protein